MSLYKPTYTRDGKTYEVKVWWLEYRLNGRKIRRSLETKDRRAAEIRQAEILRRVELSKAGVETYVETSDASPLTLVAEFEGMMRGRGRAPDYISLVGYRLRRILRGMEGLARLTPERIRTILDGIQEEGELGARTRNAYRIALNSFFRWLIREERWSKNPVAAIEPARVVEPDEPRRALTAEELECLLAAAKPSRALIYKVASTTGLRRKELRLLRWADVDLMAATVTVRASAAKGRHSDTLPLAPSIVPALRALRGDSASDLRVFRAIPNVRTLHRDLIRAGITPETPEGKIDLHALRVTFCTSLARAGVPLQVAQRLMRHSSPELTANIYTKLELHDLRAAVARVDRPASDRAKRPDPPTAAKA